MGRCAVASMSSLWPSPGSLKSGATNTAECEPRNSVLPPDTGNTTFSLTALGL